MQPVTVASFAALARSSPWRWRTLRLVVDWRGGGPVPHEPVRGWVRRPDDLRVETVGGEVLEVGRHTRGGAVLLTSDGRGRPMQSVTALDPSAPAPEVGTDGLVTSRPSRGVDYDDPMFQSYHWVAMLDPVELADGSQPAARPVVVDELRAVDHYGRPAWEALIRPTDDYTPRCSCCPLLHCAQSDWLEGDASGQSDPGFRYAEAFRVRLDVGTGVCVLTEQVGGSSPGAGHRAVIEAVDEAMPDALFVQSRRRRAPWRRR